MLGGKGGQDGVAFDGLQGPGLAQETSKLRAVVDQAGEGIVVLGRRGVIQIWSRAMERITGVCAAQATGARLPDVLTRLDVPDLEPSAIADGEVRPTPDCPHVTVDVRLRRLNRAAAARDTPVCQSTVVPKTSTATTWISVASCTVTLEVPRG